MDTQCEPVSRRQMIVNWLGLAVLLALGIVTGPAGIAVATDIQPQEIPSIGGR